MVLLHGIHEPMKNIGYGVGDAAPVRDHGDAQRVSEETVRGQHHATKKHFDGTPLFMAPEVLAGGASAITGWIGPSQLKFVVCP